jgi:hypothetical protein
MSGNRDDRDDRPSGGGGGGSNGGGGIGGGDGPPDGPSDPCRQKRRGPINSPKAAVVSKLQQGSVLGVAVKKVGTVRILVALDASGAEAGSLTFDGYVEIMDCIETRGFKYKATVVRIDIGVHEVRVEPI